MGQKKEDFLRGVEAAKELEKLRALGSKEKPIKMSSGMPWGCCLWILGILSVIGYGIWKMFLAPA